MVTNRSSVATDDSYGRRVPKTATGRKGRVGPTRTAVYLARVRMRRLAAGTQCLEQIVVAHLTSLEHDLHAVEPGRGGMQSAKSHAGRGPANPLHGGRRQRLQRKTRCVASGDTEAGDRSAFEHAS